ncbi:MAG: sulfatase, partial [Spirochaetales bacterium]
MSKPNIVVIMADQLKASAIGLYGNEACPTPHLQELAQAGVAYEHAITPHPLCVPARVAFWTGKYPHETGARRNETLMPRGYDHGFRRLKGLGYHCALIGKNHCFQERDYEDVFDTWLELGHFGAVDNGWHKGDWGVDIEALRALHDDQLGGFDGPDRHLQCFAPDCSDDEHTTGAAATATASFIEKQSATNAPFALWLSFPAPHEPYIVPKRYYDRIDPAGITLPDLPASWPEGTPARTQTLYRMLNASGREQALRDCVRTYLANALFIDEAVGRVREALSKAGQLENTILVFCADHGDFAGEFNMMVKGGCFYDCLTRVPLVISWPGHVPAGVRDRDPANLIDVLPTLFELIG